MHSPKKKIELQKRKFGSSFLAKPKRLQVELFKRQILDSQRLEKIARSISGVLAEALKQKKRLSDAQVSKLSLQIKGFHDIAGRFYTHDNEIFAEPLHKRITEGMRSSRLRAYERRIHNVMGSRSIVAFADLLLKRGLLTEKQYSNLLFPENNAKK